MGSGVSSSTTMQSDGTAQQLQEPECTDDTETPVRSTAQPWPGLGSQAHACFEFVLHSSPLDCPPAPPRGQSLPGSTTYWLPSIFPYNQGLNELGWQAKSASCPEQGLALQAGSAAMDTDGPSENAMPVSERPSLLGLPASVLVKILGKACPSPYDRRLLFTLALVCRRFANVLRQPSELWNTMLLSLPKCACHAHCTAPVEQT